MNERLTLKYLGYVMQWDDDQCRREFRWLSLMSRLKYDGYQAFQPGLRFVESLLTWLQQFDQADRPEAYDFIRKRLVYIGPSEMQRLVEQFYPRTLYQVLSETVAAQLRIPTFSILASRRGRQAMKRLRRQTLFMGLSDGARTEILRRTNIGRLSNEQFVVATQVDNSKWINLLEKLRRDLDDSKARFKLIYLIDDFSGSGTSFLRRDNNGNLASDKWTGKLTKFQESLLRSQASKSIVDVDWKLGIHHYIATATAKRSIQSSLTEAYDFLHKDGWTNSITPTYGMVLPEKLPISDERSTDFKFYSLTQKYYNTSIQDDHTAVGGVEHIGLGFAGCALPLVLDHNTPNNSVALLWAEADQASDGSEPAMSPLFLRRQRHIE